MTVWKDVTDSVPSSSLSEIPIGKTFILLSAAKRNRHEAAVMIKTGNASAKYINGSGASDHHPAGTRVIPVTLQSVEYTRDDKLGVK